MSSVEAPKKVLVFISMLCQSARSVSVYQAHAGQVSYLFYFYANPSDTTVQWLSDVHEKKVIEQEHLPLVIPHGL